MNAANARSTGAPEDDFEARRGAHVLLAVSASVAAFLGWFLLELLARTRWLAQGTSIGSDAILGFHLLGIGAIAGSAATRRHLQPGRGRWVFVAACVVELSFLLLNLSGKVWEYRKEGPDGTCAAARQLFLEFLR